MANRAVGEIALAVASTAGRSRRTDTREAGSLRVRFPSTGADLEAVIINTAGGAAGGDRYDLDVTVGADARLTVTTAAAEKIYRSLGTDTTVAIRLRVEAGGTLHWLPQETIVFDRSQLSRTIDIELAPGASLLVAEALVFGRTAMGEAVEQGRVHDRWRVRLGRRLIFAEAVRLDGAIAGALLERPVAAGGSAIATVLKLPADAASAAALAGRVGFAGEVGVSAWNGFALARLCARDGAALRQDLRTVLASFGEDCVSRLWLN
ncbi:MAG: urease accessory protein UreD [Xanthobacteraceae bacterium]